MPATREACFFAFVFGGGAAGGAALATAATALCIAATGGACAVIVIGAGIVGAIGGGALGNTIVSNPIQNTITFLKEARLKAPRVHENIVDKLIGDQVRICEVFGC